MKLNQYQESAMEFRLPTAGSHYALLNLTGEVGELNSLLAKSIRDGVQEDFSEQVKKELGDILWMLTAVATDHGTSLEEVAEGNLRKLGSRADRGTLTGSGDNR